MNVELEAANSGVISPEDSCSVAEDDQTELLAADLSPRAKSGQTDSQPPECTIGRYQIVSEIARGGMGVIFKAWDPLIGRAVAIKLLHQHFCNDTAFTERFELEARINGRLDHPSIVPVHELGTCSNGRPFFVMRFIEGLNLSSMLSRRENPQSQQGMLLRVFEKICQGVAHSHTCGVINRDLKPANVIVGNFGVVNIVDWGLGKYLRSRPGEKAPENLSLILSPDETCHDSVIGTPAYLPPEQARGEHELVDKRADVFCLGGILCHILTGAAPYNGTLTQRLEQAASADLAGAFERLDLCHAEREVVELARRCLSPNRSDRPIDGTEVSDAITAYLESDVRRAERDLVRFFDLSLDLFCIAGLDGYFRRINPNFARLLGFTESEIMAQPFSSFIHPDDREATAQAMKDLALGRPVVNFTNRYRHASGRYLYLEWAAQTEAGSGGNIYAMARDVTDRFSQERQSEPV